ncbi:GAF domain-containing protein [Meiothermus sp. QL-1]|uniref:GAF domain-containing protein n=1 Tax=Meiothermus sp. QL-1 TaxID=2058095 RepID=UPI000E0A10FA|nr:GAF domain-containing protein [Meiothermus sp. QL-1]RDI95952.1 GAF domain-containing protein [Meiothermus sp. QL-1]
MSAFYQGMLALLRELVDSPSPEALLRVALERALRLIPGAQAGSALLREGPRYRFAALQGHAIPLPDYPISLEAQLRWYGGSLEEALEARPRITRASPDLSGLAPQDRRSLQPINWSLNIPLPILNRVEAWLCLDRFEAAPFPQETLAYAKELGQSLVVALLALKERQNTQARLEREERLARALAALGAFQEAKELWQALPQLMLEVLGAESAVVLQREGDELVVAFAANWEAPLGHRIPRGKGIAWGALERRRVEMIAWDDPRVYLRPEALRDHYAVYVPLHDGGQQDFGVVAAYAQGPFGAEDIAVLEAFGQGVGQALARLLAQAAQARELTRLKTLAQISSQLSSLCSTEELLRRVVTVALEQTRASTSLLCLYRPDEDLLEIAAAAGYAAENAPGARFGRGQGLAWRVLESRQPLYLPDASSHPEAVYLSGRRTRGSYLGVPLSDPEGRLMGVLSVDTAGVGGDLQPHDRYVMEALAEVTGVVYSRLRALEKAWQETTRYRRLVQMSAELESLEEPASMARRALETLIELTGFSAGGFYQLKQEQGLVQLIVGHEETGQKRLGHFAKLPVVLGQGFMGLALATGRVQHIEDYQTWEGAWPALKPHNLRTLLTAPLFLRGAPYGALTLASFDRRTEVSEEDKALLEAVARRLERALERAAHLEEIHRTREDALRALGLGLELRDLETRGHTERVVALSEALGRALGFPDLEGLRLGAYLHDLGKLAIPDAILLKPGPLTEAEWRTMQSHCDIGFGMLESLGFLSQTARNIVRYHHERMDGSGYPFGLKGEEIPLEARLFAVVDVYDALMHERPYKPAWSQAEALEELERQAGRTLDAGVVRTFIRLVTAPTRIRKHP